MLLAGQDLRFDDLVVLDAGIDRVVLWRPGLEVLGRIKISVRVGQPIAPDDITPEPQPQGNRSILWLAALGIYWEPITSRPVTWADVRQSFEESLATLTKHTDSLVDDLRSGRMSLTEWRSEMRDTIKQVQMSAAELAHGGRAQMTQADYGRVGQKVYVQYQYLDRWVEQIKAGAPFDNTMEARASLYLRNGRVAFVEAEKEVMRDRGFELVRNVLHAQESCAECIAEADRGLVPVEAMSIPGSRTCLANCRCVLVYERAA